jgi:hypothetical protein
MALPVHRARCLGPRRRSWSTCATRTAG